MMHRELDCQRMAKLILDLEETGTYNAPCAEVLGTIRKEHGRYGQNRPESDIEKRRQYLP